MKHGMALGLVAALLLSAGAGCGSKTKQGAGIGAAAGAVAGAIIGHQSGHKTEGAVIGAVAQRVQGLIRFHEHLLVHIRGEIAIGRDMHAIREDTPVVGRVECIETLAPFAFGH